MNCSLSFCTQLLANGRPKAAGKHFCGNPAPSFSTILSLPGTSRLVPSGKIQTKQSYTFLYNTETSLWMRTFVVFTKSEQVTSLFEVSAPIARIVQGHEGRELALLQL